MMAIHNVSLTIVRHILDGFADAVLGDILLEPIELARGMLGPMGGPEGIGR
jgi:hypothetical protein